MSRRRGIENKTFPVFLPIERKTWNCTDGLFRLVSGNIGKVSPIIELAIRVRTNKTSKKLFNGNDREITLEVSKYEISRGRKPLNALFLQVQGMLNFFQCQSNQHMICKSFKHLFKKEESTYYCDIDISKISPNMWPESRWNIHGYISVYECMETDQYFFQGCPDQDVDKLELCNDFQYLQFEKHHLSDITLKCFDVNIFAHRIILASRSTVFKAMLQKSTKEYQSGEILITDIQPHTLKKMLKYIYCAQIDELSEDSAMELLYAADKYRLEELKKKCVAYLKSEISNSNVFRILNVAALHDEALKLWAYEHIAENFKEIEKSREWKELKVQNSALVYDILAHTVRFK